MKFTPIPTPPNHAAANPSLALRLQSDALAGRVAELGSLRWFRAKVVVR